MKIEEGELGAVEGAEMTSPACEKFHDLQAEFRGVVSEVTEAFVDAVDRLQGATNEHGESLGRKLMADKAGGVEDGVFEKHFESVRDILDQGTQLEHFHTYEKFHEASAASLLKQPEAPYSIDLHVDQGLFIALAPAMVLSGADSGDHGFYIELPSGEIVQPEFGSNNELVFMIGDGFAQWLNHKLDVPFRATPHAMAMPEAAGKNTRLSIRSWYGRMVLPRASAFLESQGKTFGELKREFGDRNLHAESALTACSTGFTLATRQLAMQCPEGSVLCWAQCRPIATCSDTEEGKCMEDQGDGTFAECDATQHIGSCAPVCFETIVEDSQSQQTVELGNGFCNGFRVSMFMDGFSGVGDEGQQCLVFLFTSFILDDATKYVLAAIASIVIGIFTEFIVYCRRYITNKMSPGSMLDITKIFLYAMQVTFGYIAMLIAMTYSAVLFVMIVLGLSIGHRMFNFNVKPTEFSDPCCAQPVEKEAPVAAATNDAKASL